MVRLAVALSVLGIVVGGCAPPSYMAVPPADPVGLDRRLAPSWPEQAATREQHLSGLRAELRFMEDALLRAEQNRLNACREPDAAQLNTAAYARCQFMDQLYEQRKRDTAQLREQYLRGVSGSGGPGR
jgi:hypothetical protein